MPLLLFIILINSPQRLDTKIPFNSLGRFFFASAININPLLAHVWSSSKHTHRPPARAPRVARGGHRALAAAPGGTPRQRGGPRCGPRGPRGRAGCSLSAASRCCGNAVLALARAFKLTILIGARRLRARRPRPETRPGCGPLRLRRSLTVRDHFSLCTHSLHMKHGEHMI